MSRLRRSAALEEGPARSVASCAVAATPVAGARASVFAGGASPAPLLEVSELRVVFAGAPGQAPSVAVDGLSFALQAGETLGLVGESGCGKSVAARSLVRLLPAAPACRIEGRVRLDGQELLTLPEAELRRVRGRRIAYVFQDPAAALDPLLTAGEQVAQALRHHFRLGRRAAREEAAFLLQQVGLPGPFRLLDAYPHQLSGGMQQRVAIALALACRPALLVADEPTASLDVTVQAQLLGLLARLQRVEGLAILLISHDPDVVASLAQRLGVIYAGRLVEIGETRGVLADPGHPYTRGLLRCRPRLSGPVQPVRPIPGAAPDPASLPAGCRFAARCSLADVACHVEPPLTELAAGRAVACHRPRGGLQERQ